jgi:hypothetical protein
MSDRIKMQMHDRNRKQPNALKHGSFTQMTILPGENAREFAKLHHAVREEWNPNGPTEEDAVLTIAKGIWRKSRVQKFLLGKAMACSVAPTHPAYDEVSVLRSFCKLLEIKPDLLYERLDYLSEEVRQHLELKVLRQKFSSTSERARAIQKEITSVLLPARERVEKAVETCLYESAAIVSMEDVQQEIALDEHIDATIERAIKRLIQSKTIKQMVGQASPKKFEESKPRSLKVVGQK